MRSTARYIETLGKIQGNIPYASFPSSVPWEATRGGEMSGAEYLGWHTFRVRNAEGRGMTFLIPDARFVRPGDEAAYRTEMDRRLDWLLDGKLVPGAPSAMLRGARLVTLAASFPRGTTLGAGATDARLVAEGAGPVPGDAKGDPKAAGESVARAMRELAARVDRAGRRYGGGMPVAADLPGDAWEGRLAPYEYGGEPPPTEPQRGQTGLERLAETAARVYTRRPGGSRVITFGRAAPPPR